MKRTPSNPTLYSLPLRERDPMGVIFPSIGVAIWLGAASCWAATQAAARGLGYQPALGRPLYEHIYSPFELVVWAIKFDHPAHVALAVHRIFVHAYEIIALGNSLGLVIAALMAGSRFRRLQRHTDLYGSAHWASRDEVRATGLVGRDRGVYVGAWREPQSKRTMYLRDASATHCLAFMPTGSGKTVGLVIPTLLSWERSAVVHDLKGEIWDRVYRFEPTAADGSSLRLNPFDRIRIGTDFEVQDVQNIVELIADEGDKPARGDNRFWVEMAKRLLLGLSLHVKHDDDPHNDSLPGVAAALTDPRHDDFDQLFEHLRSYPHDPSHSHGWLDADGRPTATHPLVAQIAAQMLAMEDRVKANIVAEAQSFLTLYSDSGGRREHRVQRFRYWRAARQAGKPLPCRTASA